MGGVVSDSSSNTSLVKNLIESGHLSKVQIEEALLIVDRGKFLSNFENRAYENRSWKVEDYYLDPSWVYSEVFNELKLKHGDSLLHIASGVGFFSLVASILIGYEGKQISIDSNPKAVHYASTRHQNFVDKSTTFDMQETCETIYLVGDITKFKPGFATFDKVFCNATITIDLLPLLLSFVKVKGILIVAIDENLLKCERLDEKRVYFKKISYIQMPLLIVDRNETKTKILDLYPKSPLSNDHLFKNSENGITIILEYDLDNLTNLFPNSIEQRLWHQFQDKFELKPNSLQKLCRGRIRNLIRKKFELDNSEFKSNYFKKDFMKNSSYELQRLEILHYGLTNCCLKRSTYSQANVTSKLNCKFKDYRMMFKEHGLDGLKVKSKKELCDKCRVIDSLTLIELGDHEYLKTTDQHFRYFIEERIKCLPLPNKLINYLNYNRIFGRNYEDFYSPNDNFKIEA